MKKQLLYFTLSLALVAFVTWSCDNGNADPIIIDGPPVIESITVTAGQIENTDFAANAVVNDGVAGSTISTLANATWSITGPATASGQQSLSGDQATINIAVAGGFPVGDYDLSLTVTDSNGNAATDNVAFTVGLAVPDFDISGDWRMEPVAGAFKVGPEPGSGEWWQNNDADVAARACHFDDIYTFAAGASGTFSIDMGDATWLETFQGVDADQCGTPVDPFVSGDYQFLYTETELTLIGRGAAVGLAKVNNEGEISQGAAVADQITYNITSQTMEGDVRRMTLQIEAADGVWWEFLLISGDPVAQAPDIEGVWKLEPVAGALGVGPGQGDVSWWASGDGDVTGRACLFDDTYTFEGGTFTMDLGSETWLEPFQGKDPEGCGTPVAPHDGMGSYTYEVTATTLKLIGQGAHVGLGKVANGVELGNPADAPDDITYIISDFSEDGTTRRMTVQIFAGGETWWQFLLISE